MADFSEMHAKLAKNSPTPDQAKDTGMAFVLFGLLMWLVTKNKIAILISIGILLITMAFPRLLKPAARMWFGFSKVLGIAASHIVLALIFFCMVLPMGILRRWAQKDTLQLKAFKRKNKGGFIERHHHYIAEDLMKPY